MLSCLEKDGKLLQIYSITPSSRGNVVWAGKEPLLQIDVIINRNMVATENETKLKMKLKLKLKNETENENEN